MTAVFTFDFETHAAGRRPHYPPEPVGMAYAWPGEEPRYLAWGHPEGNNAEPGEAREVLERVWRDGIPVLAHNAKFDLAVCYERLGLRPLPWRRVHDTMFLAFLADPHARSLGLKDLAEDLLSWPAEERDEVAEWIWTHRVALVARFGGRITRAKHGPSSAGAWIARAPGDLVGRYAVGDVARTAALFARLHPIIQREGMGDAYDRERRLLPILMEQERVGLRVDLAGLERDIEAYQECLDTAEAWMRRELRASGLNFDADRDVAAILAERDAVPEDAWVLTASGQPSVAKNVLTPDKFRDPRLASALGYRNRLVTCLNTFMRPWLEQGAASGHIHTTWHQTRGGDGGTRTGRPSTSDPNLLNLSKSFEGRSDGYVHPAHLDVAPLPLVRKYILPDEGDVFLHRDFDGQELRLFAHFECGELQRAYLNDADLDPHAFVGERAKSIARQELERTKIKILNFLSLYGGGVTAAAAQLRCSLSEARAFKDFHDAALPGRRILANVIKSVANRGDPIRTWGGRLYWPEPPKVVDGKMRDFIYKLLNYLIQGSAADLTKEVICRWYDHPDRDARFLVTVYDEINVSAPCEKGLAQMRILRDCMEDIELNVPMRSSGKAGSTWGDQRKVDAEWGLK